RLGTIHRMTTDAMPKGDAMRASLTSFFAALAAAALIAGCASTTTDDQTAAPVTESGRSGSEAARSQGIQSTPVKPVDVTGQPGETVSDARVKQGILAQRSVFYDFDKFDIKEEYRPMIE